jgi:hypothetical protein
MRFTGRQTVTSAPVPSTTVKVWFSGSTTGEAVAVGVVIGELVGEVTGVGGTVEVGVCVDEADGVGVKVGVAVGEEV